MIPKLVNKQFDIFTLNRFFSTLQKRQSHNLSLTTPTLFYKCKGSILLYELY